MSLKQKSSILFSVILILFLVPASLMVTDNLKLRGESHQSRAFFNFNETANSLWIQVQEKNFSKASRSLTELKRHGEEFCVSGAEKEQLFVFLEKTEALLASQPSAQQVEAWRTDKEDLLRGLHTAKRTIELTTKTYSELYTRLNQLLQYSQQETFSVEVVKAYAKDLKEAASSSDYPKDVQSIASEIHQLAQKASKEGSARASLRNKAIGLKMKLSAFINDKLNGYTQVVDRFLLIATLAIACIFLVFGLIFASLQKSILRPMEKIVRSLTDATTEIKDVSSDLVTNSKGLKEVSQSQRAAVGAANNSIHDISSTVTETTMMTVDTTKNSTNNRDLAVAGQTNVNRMGQSMEDLKSQNSHFMKRTRGLLADIHEVVKMISEVSEKTAVINDIVFQTKLLSFNASVEASRAGEAGKGFAVVAEEIGKLADVSGQSSKEISDILQSRTTKIEEIVKIAENEISRILDESNAVTEAGLEVANQCQDSLTEIVGGASQIMSSIDEISSAAQVQEKGILDVTTAINTVVEMSEKTHKVAGDVNQRAAFLEKQGDNLQQVCGSLEQMFYGTDNKKAS